MYLYKKKKSREPAFPLALTGLTGLISEAALFSIFILSY
jgi:hypothetical protein